MKKTGTKRIGILLFISLFILGILFILSLILGAEKIDLSKIFAKGSFENLIIFRLRLPRTLLVLLSGILLGGAGAVFQLFFRNPLAEPGIMGISSGATLGTVIFQALGFSLAGKFFIGMNFFAFIGSLIAGLVMVFIAGSYFREKSTVLILLCGYALGTLYSSVSSILLLVQSSKLQGLYSWLLGSFNGKGWKEFDFIIIPSVISILLMFCMANSLDLLTGGEKSASSLGVDIGRLRICVLFAGSLACSCVACAGGTIGFIGLIAPHLVRKIIGPRARILIPFSMFFGAIVLIAADILARTVVAPSELPAGLITSILGVPFFIFLCVANENKA